MGMTEKSPVLLCILDGWAIRPDRDFNAVALANTPNFDRLWAKYPHTLLRADGLHVGLPEGQFGNSEVGHTNIGAGRVVMQDLPRITLAAQDGSLAQNLRLLNFIAQLKQSGGAAHLMGLVSPGGVHAYQDHIVALAKIIAANGVKVILHIITDGRDTPPASAAGFVEQFLQDLQDIDGISVGTVCGRFYAMDRDNRWERVSQAWAAMVRGEGVHAPDALTAIQNSYAQGEQDEFVKPSVIGSYKAFAPEDGVLMANFRSDRAREILRALVQPDFGDFDRGDYKMPHAALGMVEYSDDLNTLMPAIFAPENLSDLLGEVVAAAGRTQLRAAETEKYPHVTFFFNGGREAPYEGEERLLVASPKVATYDLQPEMSAPELTDKIIAAVESRKFDLMILNFANPDMVGHSGDLQATIKAVETVDTCVGKILAAIQAAHGTLVVTADHGNADMMQDPITKQPHTAHTTFPVPFIVAGKSCALRDNGRLADIAPTLLHLLDIKQPEAMTGKNLIA